MVNDGRLKVRPVKGENNMADIGTKILSKPRIDYLKQLIGICVIPHDSSAPTCSQVMASQPARALRSLILGASAISAGGFATEVAMCQPGRGAEGVSLMVTLPARMGVDTTPWMTILVILSVILIAVGSFVLGRLTATKGCGDSRAYRRDEPQLPSASPGAARPGASEQEKLAWRSVRTQSQVTYRRTLAVPRFQPLNEREQGAWSE